MRRVKSAPANLALMKGRRRERAPVGLCRMAESRDADAPTPHPTDAAKPFVPIGPTVPNATDAQRAPLLDADRVTKNALSTALIDGVNSLVPADLQFAVDTVLTLLLCDEDGCATEGALHYAARIALNLLFTLVLHRVATCALAIAVHAADAVQAHVPVALHVLPPTP